MYISAMNEFSHIDSKGDTSMVDVSGKAVTRRTASAMAKIILPTSVKELLEKTGFQTGKGSIIQTAVLAGIMGAKKTSELIPLCHPLLISKIDVKIETDAEGLIVVCTAVLDGKTGVEMEALTGACIASLTIYDMCKALSHEIVIKEIKLLEKTGGKSDFKIVE